jgi:hypothetical protein
VDAEPPVSPTKGILMTPGTAAARRKTVSFGDGVVDNEVKQTSRTGLPDDYPGKFPSPWVKSTLEASDDDEPVERSKGRSKVTEALEQAREGSAKRNAKQQAKQSKGNTAVEVTSDLTNPESESGQYWKQEYDIYRERTTREVRKLVLKQKAAKSFARDKDMQCTELAEQLRQEKRKVERLEKRAAELEAELREYKERTAISQPSVEVSRRHNDFRPIDPQPVYSRSYEDHQSYIRETGQDSALFTSYPADADKSTTHLPPKSRPRPTSTQPRLQSQAWTTSNPNFERSKAGAPSSHLSGRAVTSGTGVTPLPGLGTTSQTQEVYSSITTTNLRGAPIEPYALPTARQDSAFPSPELSTSNHLPINGHNNNNTKSSAEAPQTSLSAKENLPPTVRVSGPRDEITSLPAMAATSSNNKRIVSKSGQVVGADRLAAAKARLQARGRNVS